MNLYKGTGLAFLRKLMQKAGKHDELLSKLTPEEQKDYSNAMPISWHPIQRATEIYVKATPLLYPGDPSPLRRFGRELAKDNLNGIYKIILRMVTLDFAIEQSAKLWRLYNDTGVGKSERGEGKVLIYYIVEEYPDLPAKFREHLCGYISSVIDLTGTKHVRVDEDESSMPAKWKWRATVM